MAVGVAPRPGPETDPPQPEGTSFVSGARVLSIGIASTGIFTFAYLATASHVLDQVGVNITPGVGFGAHGEGYFRLSVTAPDPRLEEAMTRLRTLKL